MQTQINQLKLALGKGFVWNLTARASVEVDRSVRQFLRSVPNLRAYLGGQRGALVPGSGGGDVSGPWMLEPGELVVPKNLVGEVAPWARSRGIPGMQLGGLVPNYVNPVKAEDRRLGQLDANLAAAAVWKLSQSFIGTGTALPPGQYSSIYNLARAMVSARFGPAQFPPWNALEMREAGYNVFATNPSSGAFGIPQALPKSKLPPAGQSLGIAGSVMNMAAAQIGWMDSYIAGRYGNPAGAWAHEVAHNWYDDGGVLRPGLNVMWNGTGRDEALVRAERGGGAGGLDEERLAAVLVRALRAAGVGAVYLDGRKVNQGLTRQQLSSERFR
jgi:hypothetical protein